MKKYVAMLVLVCLTLLPVGCKPKAATTVDPAAPVLSAGDQFIHDVKHYGPALVTAIEEGIKQEALLAQDAVDSAGNRIPAVIGAALHKKLEPWLQGGLKTTRNFVELAQGWNHFDASNKDDIRKFLNDAFSLIQQIYQDGILQIKNPQSQQIASGILSSAKVILTLWQTSFLEAQQ